MLRTSLFLLSAICFLPSAQAGRPVVRVEGTLIGAGAPIGSVFQNAVFGDPFVLDFELLTPGTPGQPGVVYYPVDQSTFVVTVGNASVGITGPANLQWMNDSAPGDRLILSPAPLVGGFTLVCDVWGNSNNLLQSTDPFQSVGTHVQSEFFDWTIVINGQGAKIRVEPQRLTILVREGTPTCFGDGTGTACPCGNTGATGAGCANSLGTSGMLSGSGHASVSSDTLSLVANGVTNSPGLYFQGTTVVGGGAGGVFGDGLFCASGSITRLGVAFASGQTSALPNATLPTAISVLGSCAVGDQRVYQLWYRDANPTFCSPAFFNLTNALSVTWGS